MIHVCVPVLRRYDLLKRLLESLKDSTVPYNVHIIDNGRNGKALMDVMFDSMGKRRYDAAAFLPDKNLGVAASWNWFIQNVPEERIICNDDIIFAPDSLERMSATTYDIAWSFEAGFSCFLIRDRCVATVGLFDETISPGYGYYEDQDYAMRLNGMGTKPPLVPSGHVECGVQHPVQSETLNAATRKELGEHHKKFLLARQNFARKWGAEAVK